MAQTEDERLFEEEKSLSKEAVLANKEVSFGHNGLGWWVEDKCLIG